jgi:hypothetical protein
LSVSCHTWDGSALSNLSKIDFRSDSLQMTSERWQVGIGRTNLRSLWEAKVAPRVTEPLQMVTVG